jgi:hypothetical protein
MLIQSYEETIALVSQWQPNSIIYGVNNNRFFIAMQAENPLLFEGDTYFIFACYTRSFGRIFEDSLKLVRGMDRLPIVIKERINRYKQQTAHCRIITITDFDFDNWKPKEKE